MDILINHLTRMQPGYVCVAGIDLQTHRHIRPVRPGIRLKVDCLVRNGGPFDMGHIVSLGQVRHQPGPPHVEDHEPQWANVRSRGVVDGQSFWKSLKSIGKPTLRAIFGPEIQARGGGTCGIDAGKGTASLGCLIWARRPSIYVKPRLDKPDQVRMKFTDGALAVDVSVTDIRLYCADHVTPDRAAIARVSSRLKNREPVILAVGVGRAWTQDDSHDPIHWLQVNAIHFEDSEVWQLGPK